MRISRLAKVALVLAALALLAVALWPRGRALAQSTLEREARRRAIATLRDATGGDVAIGRAEVPSLRELVLSDVVVSMPRSRPEIASLSAKRVTLRVPEGESITGTIDRVERLSIDDGLLLLRHADSRESPATAGRGALPRIALLEIARGAVGFNGGEDLGGVVVDGTLRDVGGDMSGELALRADNVPMLDWAAFFGHEWPRLEPWRWCCGALDGRAVLAPGGGASWSGTLVVPPGTPLGDAPTTVAIGGGSSDLRRDARISLDAPEHLHLDVALVADSRGRFEPASLDGALDGITPAWLASPPLVGQWTSASLDVHATRIEPGRHDVRAEILARGPHPDVTITATGTWEQATGVFDGHAEAAHGGRELARATGRMALPTRSASVRVSADAGALNSLQLIPMPPLPAGISLASAGRLEADLSADGSGAVAGPVTLSELKLQRGDASLVLRRARATVSAGRDAQSLDAIRATIAGTGSGVEATGSLKGRVTRRGGRARGAIDAELAFGKDRGIASASLELRGDAGTLHAEMRDAQAGPWLLAMKPGSTLVPGGAATGVLDAAWSPGEWSAAARGELKQAGLQSKDFTRAVQLPRATFAVDASGTSSGERLSVRAESEGAQVLWGGAFADLGALRPSLTATLRRDGRVGAWSGDVALAAGSLSVASRIEELRPGWRFDGALAAPDLATAWKEIAATGVLDSSPALKDAKASGSLRLPARGSVVDGALDATATIDLDAASFATTLASRELSLTGLDLDVPLRALRPKDSPLELTDASERGRLVVSDVRAFGAEAHAIDLPLTATSEGVVLDGDVPLTMLGGRLTLGHVTLSDPLSTKRALQASVDAEGLQLSKLGPVGPFTLSGSVSAKLPRVSASATRLDVQGGAHVLAFGGEILVDEISGENPWSRFPRTRIAAHFDDIDLHELTSTFGFGAVEGVAQGEVKELELFGLAPARFDARIETVPREGVRQVISIPALQNLATLATGGRAPLFDKGLLKLIKTLRYETIGMAATLHGDEFVLRGLAERNGRELFMKGRLPFRVDVANAQPGAAVSFHAMMARLKGLEPPSPDSEAPAAEPSAPPPEQDIEIH